MRERRLTPGLLFLSAAIFMLLIPGGPIENRVFPDLSLPAAIFISLVATILNIGAFYLAFRTRRGGRRALNAAACGGACLASFYVMDLSGLCMSATPMSASVRNFEIAGLAVAILLIGAVMRDLRRPMTDGGASYRMSGGEKAGLIGLTVYVGAILTFIAAVNFVSHNPGSYIWYGIR
jgi:hypothetical protein